MERLSPGLWRGLWRGFWLWCWLNGEPPPPCGETTGKGCRPLQTGAATGAPAASAAPAAPGEVGGRRRGLTSEAEGARGAGDDAHLDRPKDVERWSLLRTREGAVG